MSDTGQPSSESHETGHLPDTIRLRFKTMEPANYDVTVSRDATIASVKADHLAAKVNAPADRQRVIFRGRALQDAQTLREAGVEDNDTLHLVVRPADSPVPPGMPGTSTTNSTANIPNLGAGAGLFPGAGGLPNFVQGFMQAFGQPGTVQFATGNAGLPGNIQFGTMPAAPGGAAATQQAAGGARTQAAAGAAGAPGAAGADPRQQPGVAGAGVGPGFPGWPDFLSGSSPPWLQAPHLLSSINSYLEVLQSPDYNLPHMPLAWHPIQPGVDQGLALQRLTDGLREVLQGVYLPADLRTLLEATQTDREGRTQPAPAGDAAGPAGAAGAAGTAGAAGPAGATGATGRTAPAAGAGPAGALPGGIGFANFRGAAQQQIPDFSNYRYLPLAAAALAELVRRADTHISSSLTRRMRELTGAIMAQAGDHRNRALEQNVQLLGQHLGACAALLTELSRLATGVSSALQGNVAPLVFSRPALLQASGGTAASLPVLQPQVVMGPGGNQPIMNALAQAAQAAMNRGAQPGQAPGGPRPPRANLTPEQLQELQQRMLGRGGQGAAGVHPGQGGVPGATGEAAGAPGAGDAAAGGVGGGNGAVPPGMPFPMQGTIHIDIVDDGSGGGGGDLSATLGPLLNSMLGPMMGGLGLQGMPDMSALLQQHQQNVEQQQRQQQQQRQGTPGGAPGAASGAQQPAGAAGEGAGGGAAGGAGGGLASYISVLRPMIRSIAASAANTVVQRLQPLQPLLQTPAQTAPLVGTLVSEVLNETMSNAVDVWAAHEEQFNAALQHLEDAQAGAGADNVQETVRQVQALVNSIMSGRVPTAGFPFPQAPAHAAPAAAAPAPAAAPASGGAAAAAAAAQPGGSDREAGAREEAAPEDTTPSKKPRVAAAEAAVSRQLASTSASADGQPMDATEEAAAAAADKPSAADAPSSSSAAAGGASASAAAAPAAAGPRGLGLGLKPMAKKKATPTAATSTKSEQPGGAGAGSSSAAAEPSPGATPAGPGAGAGFRAGPAGGAPPDMGNLMAVMSRMMSGAGGAPGSGPGAGARAPAPGAGAQSSQSMNPQSLQGLQGLLGGAGGGAGGGGLGGLMQMANSLASDPAMQPMLQNAMSSLLGGGAGGGGAAGGAGGLGSLLSSLMGGMSAAGAPASSSRGGVQVEEVLGLEVLDQELSPEEAAQWRTVIERDQQAQEDLAQAGQGQGAELQFSEVYRAGLPQQPAGLMDRLHGSTGI